MIMSGTTSFCDMYFFMDEVGHALETSGMRGILTRGIVEDPERPEEKLSETRELFKEWNNRIYTKDNYCGTYDNGSGLYTKFTSKIKLQYSA